ncbi:EboA domain-containing protein [Bradyrhizobium sp.]|uniref:EboA domain-containing protein n=1 Tax=Bradyrhizobium sp. TaxID=376 RepID=UPI0039E6033C
MKDSLASGQSGTSPSGDQARIAFIELVQAWISRSATEDGRNWFNTTLDGIRHSADTSRLAFAIGLAPRRLGKADLTLSAEDRTQAAAIRANLDPGDWSIDQAARIAFSVASHHGDDAAFVSWFDGFCATAGINELIALCRGLPVYPAPTLIEPRAREAVRSGMRPVFEAVAHCNPYPVEYFAEDAWNQMVVKAFFIGAHLWPIQALDRRGNPRLARMLVDLAQERWAAGRPVSGEVWRCVAPHADNVGDAALVRAFDTGDDKERLAVALALQQAGEHRVDALFERPESRQQVKTLQSRLASEGIGWKALS